MRRECEVTVKSIVLVDETDTYATWNNSNQGYDEPAQGTTFELIRIYKVENSDGPDQYFKFVVELDSYGNAGGNYSSASDSIPRSFTEVKPVTKTVTVFQ